MNFLNNALPYTSSRTILNPRYALRRKNITFAQAYSLSHAIDILTGRYSSYSPPRRCNYFRNILYDYVSVFHWLLFQFSNRIGKTDTVGVFKSVYTQIRNFCIGQRKNSNRGYVRSHRNREGNLPEQHITTDIGRNCQKRSPDIKFAQKSRL